MNKIDLSYIAGFFDGEGSITIHQNGKPSPRGKNPNHTMQVSIGNTNPLVLKWIKAEFGGGFVYRKSKNPKHKNIAQWNLRAKSTLPFLLAIKPYLRMKIEQALLAIKFQKTKKMQNKEVPQKTIIWREEQRIKMRELNARSWI